VWSQYWKEKCNDLTWHDNQEIVFKKKIKKLKTKTTATTTRLSEPAWNKQKKLP